MSYCRWSSDNWKCDIYAYGHVDGGYAIHVAGNRIVGEVPKLDISTPERWFETYEAQRKFMHRAQRVPIGLPYDGESYREPTLKDFWDRLVMLKVTGYHIPQEVFDEVFEEIQEENARANQSS